VTASPDIDIDDYLAQHEKKELVRFVTVGSVDDGKSTLIGRLLHDTHGVYDDQLAAVRAASAKKNEGEIDFSLFTDGLKAEREQGITIDVAYRYFATERRKFIIADTPGHEQYTRNMATGASTADIAIILVDARLGVLPQSRRHAAIASFLGIRELIVCINKMDLVGFAEARFRSLVEELSRFLAKLRFRGTSFIPVSAKRGDNIVERSASTPYYDGPTLLGLLETLPVVRDRSADAFRFPVQYVLRPHLDYRGFAGAIAEGEVRLGDPITVLPSGRRSVVAAIDTFDGPLDRAFAPMSVTLRLADEVDVSRGDMLVHPDRLPFVAFETEATLVWLAERPFDPSRRLLMKHASRIVPARVIDVVGHVSLETLETVAKDGIALNDIARVRVRAARPIFCDPYVTSRATGAFILIDALDNGTVAAGMIESAKGIERARDARATVTQDERRDRLGHVAVIARVDETDPRAIERILFDRGLLTIVVATHEMDRSLVEPLATGAVEAGLVVLVAGLDDASFAALAARTSRAIDTTNVPGVEEAARRIAEVAFAAGEVQGGGGI
jgi:bifunctional enzyme CysN/CysC